MSEIHHAAFFSPTLEQLQREDAVGQLRRRDSLMAELGSENDELKLDWVEGIARLLADDIQLEEIENEARALWNQGIRHIIWAGMGGSVITVRVLKHLEFCEGDQGQRVAIYPLDSTDPATLNAIIREIAATKQLALPTPGSAPDQDGLRTLLGDVMMIGVAMGMTSEEPITHLAWFTELLEQAGLSPAEHLLVMTLPDSYLDRFARERNAPSRPLQPDRGTGTGGRMSAPTTRVFLLPAALYLTRLNDTPGQLRALLRQAWQQYDLELASTQPAQHPFVRLAAALYDASNEGACRAPLHFPAGWQSLTIWIEQLMEESLGKGNKGIVAFYGQELNKQAASYQPDGLLHVHITANPNEQAVEGAFVLVQPSLAASNPFDRLAAVATSFLGWQLTMALYGYLNLITFAGQPAVENYKSRARALRDMSDPLQAVADWSAISHAEPLTLLAPADLAGQADPATAFATAIKQAIQQNRLGYLDFTFNGEATLEIQQTIANALLPISNKLLGVPLKLRQAPADYHSTEQGEMDGPPILVSLRLLMRDHEPVLLGTYSDAFLRAQAVSTWQAMLGQQRPCLLMIVDGTQEQAIPSLQRFFSAVAEKLQA